jgi:hypothetical protein
VSDQLAQLIATTIVAIVVTLVHAYLTQGGQKANVDVTKEAAGVMKEANALLGSTAAASGGGGAPVRQDCRNWLPASIVPAYGQLTQSLPSGAETATWYNDCGETCCSMIVRAARGVYVAPDSLRVYLRGQGGNPLTDANALVQILNICKVGAHIEGWSGGEAINGMRAATADGRPVCALGKWPTPGGVLHWLLVYAVDSEKVYYNNPWGGVRSWIVTGEWEGYAADSYAVVDSHLLYS